MASASQSPCGQARQPSSPLEAQRPATPLWPRSRPSHRWDRADAPRRPTRYRRARGGRFHGGALGGDRHCPWGQLVKSGVAREAVTVALSIPLVLAAVFVTILAFTGIDLQRTSRWAPDHRPRFAGRRRYDPGRDRWSRGSEQGDDKDRAATFAYTSTAFPMLTGTLVTIAGFVPIGFGTQRHGRVHLLDFRRRRHRADRVPGAWRFSFRLCSASGF